MPKGQAEEIKSEIHKSTKFQTNKGLIFTDVQRVTSRNPSDLRPPQSDAQL
jgi:hypothetical protein